jgi:outer membrane receptor protein involved in Fe transport
MYNNSKVAKSIRLALMIGAAATVSVSTSAFSADEGIEKIEKIQVTGSRIKRSDMETASPVTIIDASAIAASGLTSIGDILQNLSSAGGEMTNPGINNGSGGNSTINLRGLGDERTLVLVNGRRMIASGTGAAASVDLNTIPVSMIQRVEVLKDGASAVYGTDAIAGVVNVILKRDFEGFELNAQTGSSFEGDAEESTIDFTIGVSSAKGNIVFGAAYTDRDAASQGDRGFSDCPIWDDEDGSPLYCGGSSSSLGGHVYGNKNHDITFTGVDADGNPKAAIGNSGRYGHYIQDDGATAEVGDAKFAYFDEENDTQVELSGRNEPEGSYHDFVTSGDNNDYYNYSQASYLATPMNRLNLSASGTYELTDDVLFFSEATYTKRWSKSQMAPEPIGFNFAYDPSWMTNVAGIEDGEKLTYRRRLLETGPRIFNHTVDTVRIVLGLEGELDNGFTWDVSYNKGKNDSSEQTDNLHYKTGIDNAITGKTFDPLSQVDWQDLSDYSFVALDAGGSELDIFSATLSGELFELPAGVVAFATGYEHRSESAFFTPGSVAQLGLGADDPFEATAGDFKVDEAYLELAIPLLADVSFAEAVELSAAVRYFDYDTFGSDSTWKLGLTWKINDQLMLRGVASTAFRAPSVDELFGGTEVSFDDVKHPASNQGQALVTVGSNPDLGPEEADTLTAGIVFEPEAIEGLSLTLDYFDISLTNAIEKIDSNFVAATCLSTTGNKQNNDLAMCQNANVQISAGQITFTNLIDNVGKINTSGIDFNIVYTFDVNGLDIRTSLDTSFLSEFEKEAAGKLIDYTGQITGADGSYAEIKSNLTISIKSDDWSATYQARYIDGMDDISCGAGNTCTAPTVPSVTYSDISGSYYLTDTVTLSGGINNMFDKLPPFYTNNNDSNTDPYTYDVIGRYGYVKVKVRF